MGCSKSFLRQSKGYIKNNLLLFMLAISMLLGIGCGFLIRETNKGDDKFDDRQLMYLKFPGELFISMLKMIVVPVIVLSLISAVANLPLEAMGKLGWRVIVYYLTTTFTAVLLGILLVSTIEPGNRGQEPNRSDKKDPYVHPVDSLLDLIRNMFPSNLFVATFRQSKTQYVTHDEIIMKNGKNVSETIVDSFKSNMTGSSNVLGLIVFSIALGLMIGRMRERGEPLKIFFQSFAEAIIKIVKIIIWYSPIGIFFLLAERIASMDDPGTTFSQLGYYIMTVLLGLFIHGFILLPGLYFVLTRRNPIKFVGHMSQALLTALGTASSSATLPITMGCLRNKAKIPAIIGHFVLPVGATINMDGTALYEAVASIFIAQLNNIHLDAGKVVTVSVTATAAAIGAAGVPEAGLVTMLIVLTAVGLPTEDIALIYAVDWFLDRCRTTINVWGDSIGAGIIHHFVRDDIELLEANSLDSDDSYMADDKNDSILPYHKKNLDGDIQSNKHNKRDKNGSISIKF